MFFGVAGFVWGRGMSGDGVEKVRRTRGSASERLGKATVWINDERFSTPIAAANGWPSEVTMTLRLRLGGNQRDAASDDAGGTTAAEAATSPAAGTGRPAYAEVAHERPAKEAKSRVLSETAMNKGAELPAGDGEMPEDRAAFVEAVFARVNLVAAWERQVRSADEKIAQRALEKLDEMRYERRDAAAEERQQVEIEVTPRDRDFRN
jgi:hypothetical protein